MKDQGVIIDGEIVERLDADDPDLNASWFKFIDALDQEAGAGGSISVYEVPVDEKGIARGKTLRKTKLFSAPIGLVTLDDICDRVVKDYMTPGQCMTIQLLGTHDGRQGIRLNRMISLRKAFNEVPKGQELGGEVGAILREMREERARDRLDMQRLLSTIAENRTPQLDPFTLVSKVTELAKAMMPAPPAVQSVIPGVTPGSPMGQMVEMFATMKAMQEFFGKEKAAEAVTDKGESLGDILGKVRDIAVPLIAASNRNAGLQPRQRLPAPASDLVMRDPPPETSLPPAPPAEPEIVLTPDETPVTDGPNEETKTETPASAGEEHEMKLLAELAQLLPLLIDMAKKNGDAAEVAKMILGAMPDDPAYNDALFDFVQDENCVGRLALLNSEVEPHREWFTKLRAAMLAEFEPDAPTSTEGGG